MAISLPLVSCIMPTYGRPHFVEQAVKLFLAQRYRRSELLILDDSPKGQEAALPASPRIRLLRLPERLSMAAKHNLALGEAQGDILAHTDDDDWYSPLRLTRQVEALLLGPADVVGIRLGHVLTFGDGRFWMFDQNFGPRTGMVGNALGVNHLPFHDGTAAFRRSAVGSARYPEHPVSQKVLFLQEMEAAGAKLQPIENQGLFVYVRHGSNSWQHGRDRRLIPAEQPSYFPERDLAFYRRRSA